jgi:hypothetical protein
VNGYIEFLLKLSSSSLILSCVLDPVDGLLFRDRRYPVVPRPHRAHRDIQLFNAPPPPSKILEPTAEVRGLIGLGLMAAYLSYNSMGEQS